MVPHLTTSLTGPLHELERLVLDRRPGIERWFRARFAEHEVPFYSSVDLRNSGFKLAPVDTNLFPGGFNNLNPDFLPLCIHAAMSAIQKLCPDAQKLVLVPENHTRNLFYLQNVATLKRILEGAGLAVRIGSLIPDLAGPTEVEAAGGDRLLLEPLKRKGNRVVLDGFDPCAVLVNNDLSGGVPAVLQGLEQTRRAAAHRRLVHAPQDPALHRLRGRGGGLRRAPGHRPLVPEPGLQPVRAGELRREGGRGVPRSQRGGGAGRGAREVRRSTASRRRPSPS